MLFVSGAQQRLPQSAPLAHFAAHVPAETESTTQIESEQHPVPHGWPAVTHVVQDPAGAQTLVFPSFRSPQQPPAQSESFEQSAAQLLAADPFGVTHREPLQQAFVSLVQSPAGGTHFCG